MKHKSIARAANGKFTKKPHGVEKSVKPKRRVDDTPTPDVASLPQIPASRPYDNPVYDSVRNDARRKIELDVTYTHEQSLMGQRDAIIEGLKRAQCEHDQLVRNLDNLATRKQAYHVQLDALNQLISQRLTLPHDIASHLHPIAFHPSQCF